MTYRYLEDLATADIAFEAGGKTLEDAFTNAGLAVFDIITDVRKIKPSLERNVAIESEDIDSLLFDWIDEILFYWDSENLVFSLFEIKIQKTGSGYKLNASIRGEELDSKKHELGQNVKSPTYHMMKTWKNDNGWHLRMVLDL